MAIDASWGAATPGFVEDPALARARAERAKKWSDIRCVEDAVVSGFHDFAHMSDTEFLDHLHKQIQSVMGTNQALEERLRQQSSVIKQLKLCRNAKERERAEVQACLKERKETQDSMEAKLQQAHRARLAEEQQLRDKDVLLHTKFATLTKERSRLEDLRRAEQRQMADLRHTFQSQEKEILSLKLQKAAYETGDDWEQASIATGQIGSSASGYEVFRCNTTGGRVEKGGQLTPKDPAEASRRASACASVTARSDYGVDSGTSSSLARTPRRL